MKQVKITVRRELTQTVEFTVQLPETSNGNLKKKLETDTLNNIEELLNKQDFDCEGKIKAHFTNGSTGGYILIESKTNQIKNPIREIGELKEKIRDLEFNSFQDLGR